MTDKKEIDKIIERLQNLELNDAIASEYVNEAIICIQNECHRSAVLMAWSVMMFVLYKEIEGWGLRDFAQRLSLRKKIRPILSMYDLNKIDDSDIIQSSHEIGFFDQNIRNKLIDHAKTRNSCGHVSQASISNYTVFEFVNDILDYSKIITSLNERDALTILQSLKNMDTSKLEETINNMSLRKLLIVLDKLMDRISTITEHQEFLESSNLFECVRLSFKTRSSEEDRVQIFDRIFTRLSSEKIGYAYQLHDDIMQWCKFSYIKEHVLKMNYLANIIDIFAQSNSFESAKIRAEVLQMFKEVFD